MIARLALVVGGVGLLLIAEAPRAAAQVELVPPPLELADPAPGPAFPWLAPATTPTPEFDPYLYDHAPWGMSGGLPGFDGFGRAWTWQLLPDGHVYRSYLAAPRESRFSGVWFHENDEGWLWDIALGGRVGALRYGSQNSFRPEGWQIDIEGAAFPRLDLENENDLVSTDFRFGVPLTYALGMFETKLAYYHLSSHLGDEFMEDHPDVLRRNYSRDAIVVGGAFYWTEDLRIYGETGYAFFNAGGSEPWEFQFGVEYSPATPTGLVCVPFAAVNAHLREENNFGGNLTAQAGWQWRGHGSRRVLRFGAHYLAGKSPHFQFLRRNEEQVGFGLWYDF